MFIRKKPNRSGSVSVQVIQKVKGVNRVIKSIGCATTQQNIDKLVDVGYQEIEKITGQSNLFLSDKDSNTEEALLNISNSDIRTVGPEMVFGKIYNHIGFNQIEEELFRHLVISRLAFPLSKLKTVDYIYRYQGIHLSVDKIYRFLDKLHDKLKDQVEQIAFTHTLKVLGGNLSVVFYDMTTLYFEASDEDDLRKTGFSKDGKHQKPQIFLGLLVGLGGYAIGYEIFEGNTYEGHTLIPFLEKISAKFNLAKPIVVADSGLLSKDNLAALESDGYEYILGARLKNEPDSIKQKILGLSLGDGEVFCINKPDGKRLIISYSKKRAAKDQYNRTRGLTRLEKKVKSGKLTKSSLNNRGYNKYLTMLGDVTIEIDYEKFEQDAKWDGLKGYVTNTKLKEEEVINNYGNLWHIERAFRMSKTDLRIRPIYHRLRNRIEAHICISFTAYAIYKELERILALEDTELSIRKAAEITHNMYQITYTLPDSKQTRSTLLKMDTEQEELYEIILKYF
ncbi:MULTISPECIES: IS1634 family transposase [unclassified Saccharicrinis]|uniref:IS1634 family transposase n=1 Tax=unclassified Saccharicrinis TaxID=2646859 RepID=UPI003D34D1B1